MLQAIKVLYGIEYWEKEGKKTLSFAQLGIPSDSILLNKTNMTAQIAPTITRNITITPSPEVNDTLIGRSTPTTSNTTLPVDNKTGEAEPLGGIK